MKRRTRAIQACALTAIFAVGTASAAAQPSAKRRAEAAVERKAKSLVVHRRRVTQAGAVCDALTARRFSCTWRGQQVSAGKFCNGAARATVYARGVDVRLSGTHCDA
jgi:hypothetical protein